MGRKCNDPQHRSEPSRPHGISRQGHPDGSLYLIDYKMFAALA